jgi:HAD superfamily hydrolase (TIGR01490 family)
VADEVKKFAVFDIDGTLIRWQLYHAVADELARLGHFGAIEYEAVKRARMTWKRRESEDSFKEYERALVNLVDQVIPSISLADWQTASRTVIREYQDQVYTYTRNLVRHLKEQGYLLFAISASQGDIVGLLAKHYGFDDFAASAYEQKDGKFTGQKDILSHERKPEALQRLADKHQASYTTSIGVGDSESDIPMLAAVEQPIAFNPTKLLFEHAKAQGWQIVVERKNVIYELRSENGKYELQA